MGMDEEGKPELRLQSSACLFSRLLFLCSGFGDQRALQLRKFHSLQSPFSSNLFSCLLTSGNVERLSKRDRIVPQEVLKWDGAV